MNCKRIKSLCLSGLLSFVSVAAAQDCKVELVPYIIDASTVDSGDWGFSQKILNSVLMIEHAAFILDAALSDYNVTFAPGPIAASQAINLNAQPVLINQFDSNGYFISSNAISNSQEDQWVSQDQLTGTLNDTFITNFFSHSPNVLSIPIVVVDQILKLPIPLASTNLASGTIHIGYADFVDFTTGSQPIFDSYKFAFAVAHEVGHIMGLGHSDNDSNLMLENYDDFANPPAGPTLTDFQKRTIEGHACTQGLKPQQAGVWLEADFIPPPTSKCGDRSIQDYSENGKLPEQCEHNLTRSFTSTDATTVVMNLNKPFSPCVEMKENSEGKKEVKVFPPGASGALYCAPPGHPLECTCQPYAISSPVIGPGTAPPPPRGDLVDTRDTGITSNSNTTTSTTSNPCNGEEDQGNLLPPILPGGFPSNICCCDGPICTVLPIDQAGEDCSGG